jgi:membrane protease subunit HflC
MNEQKIYLPFISGLFLLAYFSIFYVQETEKVIKFRLGEITKADFMPGIQFKVPFINQVKVFDARILTLDSKPERFLTSEKKNVIVDSFIKWKIGDVSLFYTSVAGDVEQANLLLDQVMKDAMRGEFSRRTINQLVSEDRQELRLLLMGKLSPIADEYGIELVDIRVKRIDLPNEVSTSVYQRMEAERARVARELRSEGAEQAELINARADKESQIILAEAVKESEMIKGRADAKAANIYSVSFSKNEKFYDFYRSLSAYQNAFENTQDTMILEPNTDFFKYFSKEME